MKIYLHNNAESDNRKTYSFVLSSVKKPYSDKNMLMSKYDKRRNIRFSLHKFDRIRADTKWLLTYWRQSYSGINFTGKIKWVHMHIYFLNLNLKWMTIFELWSIFNLRCWVLILYKQIFRITNRDFLTFLEYHFDLSTLIFINYSQNLII